MSYNYDDPDYDYPEDYDYDDYEDTRDYGADPEQEDAAELHGQHVAYVDFKCPTNGCGMVYEDGDGLVRNAVEADLHTCTKNKLSLSMEDVLGKTEPSFAKERTMNNIKVISFPSRGVSADSLKLGEYARVVGMPGTRNLGDIVLKASAGVINLTDPSAQYVLFSSPFVERLHTGDKLEITVGFTPEFEESIRSQARSNKIMAIKAVREATNWGLKESKDYVDNL